MGEQGISTFSLRIGDPLLAGRGYIQLHKTFAINSGIGQTYIHITYTYWLHLNIDF